MLRAGRDAESACMTLIRSDRERLAISMRPRFDTRAERQGAALFDRERTHFKDIVRADADTIFLALTSVAIDDGREDSRLLLALYG
jgi:hypothetical protein